jgi:hypothetical protein
VPDYCSHLDLDVLVLSKFLSSIISARLGLHLNILGRADQSGCMPSYGCVDAAATLKIALQSLKDSKQDAYVPFVDLVKDFDSFSREVM